MCRVVSLEKVRMKENNIIHCQLSDCDPFCLFLFFFKLCTLIFVIIVTPDSKTHNHKLGFELQSSSIIARQSYELHVHVLKSS